MQEDLYKAFLLKNGLTENGINSRLAKARKAEEILGVGLDGIVVNDDKMYDALVALQAHEDPKHNPMQNALRKYYIFKTGKEFPQLRYYKR